MSRAWYSVSRTKGKWLQKVKPHAMTSLLLVPLDDTVVFPTMDVTLPVRVGDEERVLLDPAPRGRVRQGRHDRRGHRPHPPSRRRPCRRPLRRRPRRRRRRAHRLRSAASWSRSPSTPTTCPVDGRTRNLEREYRAIIEEILELRGADERIGAVPARDRRSRPAGRHDRLRARRVLRGQGPARSRRSTSPTACELVVDLQRERLTELQLRKKIREDVQSGADKQQREYILRKQMESIQRELGEDGASVAEEYRKKIADAGMPEAVEEQADKELARLERMGEQSGEASMIRTYLDWLISVPWSKTSDEKLDPNAAREVLDADHAGLEDVKDRITEYLAVKKLRTERGIKEDKRSGAILTLIGPPGTGKTSIGESIARATGREFVRMSLGGVRDEAEIRGHRRTYIGALPGRLVRALRDAGTMNPVIMLDEVDKVGADWRGDPSAALLEVLDPAQNHCVPRPLPGRGAGPQPGHVHRHRERRRDDPGPAAGPHGGHPLRRLHHGREDRDRPRLPVAAPARAQRPARGRGDRLRRDPDARWCTEYTREAGVRNLERELGTILRKTATQIASGKAEAPVEITTEIVRDALGRQKVFQEAALRTAVPGVATGLAVTGTGGDVLFVEATAMKGKGEASS